MGPLVILDLVLEARNPVDKRDLAARVAEEAIRRDADGAICVSEMWMSWIDADNEGAVIAFGDRHDVLLIAAELKSGERRDVVIPFRRKKLRKLILTSQSNN